MSRLICFHNSAEFQTAFPQAVGGFPRIHEGIKGIAGGHSSAGKFKGITIAVYARIFRSVGFIV